MVHIAVMLVSVPLEWVWLPIPPFGNSIRNLSFPYLDMVFYLLSIIELLQLLGKNDVVLGINNSSND